MSEISWAWNLAGFEARTDHRIEKLDDGRCALIFSLPNLGGTDVLTLGNVLAKVKALAEAEPPDD